MELDEVKRLVRAVKIAQDALMEISMCQDFVASATALRGLQEIKSEMCPAESTVRPIRPLELVR